jgi:hypothetical protein
MGGWTLRTVGFSRMKKPGTKSYKNYIVGSGKKLSLSQFIFIELLQPRRFKKKIDNADVN